MQQSKRASLRDPAYDLAMPEFVDLHCHWIAGVDDGARSADEGIALLRGLRKLGFSHVVGTPHMRPGLFDNTKQDLIAAYQSMLVALEHHDGLPKVELSSEHYFDDVVFARLLNGEGLPYPGNRAVLLEFYDVDFPRSVDDRLFDLRRRRLLPVIAHPERYRPIWRSPEILDRLVEQGAGALLDIGAIVGKYGREPKRCAMELLERGLYHAACSDAHRLSDLEPVERAMRQVERRYGNEELRFLFTDGPQALLRGQLPE